MAKARKIDLGTPALLAGAGPGGAAGRELDVRIRTSGLRPLVSTADDTPSFGHSQKLL